ncbi:MAG: hypothetical protein BWZ04_01433 [Firmicutes bacterium ADurb.BinA205]|nr:MAG: hypothetical protein BWZ04_01433 [Firmicutes bacterium ADurb.BinA205]
MKKLMIIALGAVMLLSGCNGGNNVTPEESEVNITKSVSESQNESVTTDIKTTSEDKPVSEKKQDVTKTSTDNEMEEQSSSDSETENSESEEILINSDDDREPIENNETQESETAVYEFDDFLERDND